MGQLYVSASEIEVFDMCPRKWAFGYVEGKRLPPNDSAALGTRVHAILEKWLKEGTAPDTWTPEGEIAASGLHLLPAPKTPGLVTEEGFYFTSQRAWYTGFKDFRYRDVNGLIHVGDHKTTKSFTWAKSPEEILCHSQALIYAVDEFYKNPNDDRLALDWIYYRTTGSKKAELRSQVVHKNTVAEMFFEHVDPVAGEITKLHHEVPSDASALDFTPDFRACEAFGGCAFLSICNPTPTQRTQAIMTQANLSLADRLKAMNGARPPSPIHPPEFTAHAPAAPSVPAVFAALPQPAPGVPFSLPVPTSQGDPQASPPVPYFSAQAVVPTYMPAPPGTPPSVGSGTYEPPAAAPAPQAPPAEAPKRRGRPKKPPAAASSDVSVAHPAPAGFTLYVGCAPIGVPVTNALDYVIAAQARAGEHPLSLCRTLEALLVQCEEAGNVPSGDVVLGDTQMEQDTASVWLSRAAKVVRAFR
jgi:hypothetical protein